MNTISLIFNLEEIQQILNILGEMPVKTGAAGIFGIIKERTDDALKLLQEQESTVVPTVEEDLPKASEE